MKVYQAISYDPHKMGNPYIYSLMDEIDRMYGDVEWVYGDIFWQDEIYSVDIVHVHWPTELFWGAKCRHSISEIESRFLEIKGRGVKIVATCHNLVPHYSDSIDEHTVYEITYKQADMILHMGEYSCNLLKEKYTAAKHEILPHHIYDTIYPLNVERGESIKRLHLKAKNKYILCFGAFRDKEETDLVLDLIRNLNDKSIYVLAPTFNWRYYVNSLFVKLHNRETSFRIRHLSWLHRIFERLLISYFKYKYHVILTCKKFNPVPDNLLPYYYGVSDLCLIHRKKILNSGNVPMAMMMGKVIVGPNVGNVSELLNKMCNPTFDPEVLSSLYLAVMHGFELVNSNKGDYNKEYALNNLNTSRIATLLHHYYQEM